MKTDTRERYGSISRMFHWSMGLLVLWQMLKFFDRINDGEHWVGQVLASWHISIGILILLLAVPRIVWALRNLANRPPAPQATLHRFLTKAGHTLMYVAMALWHQFVRRDGVLNRMI